MNFEKQTLKNDLQGTTIALKDIVNKYRMCLSLHRLKMTPNLESV